MSDIFISHSSKDAEIANKVCKFLEDKGLSCWIAPRDILPGADWAASISTAVTASKVFLIIYSENSSNSNQVARELGLAESKDGVYTVPYKIDETPLKGSFDYYLAGAHWVNANYKKKDYKLDELYTIILAITGKNIQNITNNTYIDNLHIHTDGDPITAAGQVGQSFASQQMPQSAQIPNQMPAVRVNKPEQKGKSKLIPIICGVSGALLLIIILIVVISSLSDLNDDDTDDDTTSSVSSQIEANTNEQDTDDDDFYDTENSSKLTDFTLNYNEREVTGTYEGELSDNGLPDGKGKFTCTYVKDGVNRTLEYTGSFSKGVFNGKGKSTVKTDDGNIFVYDGNYLNGYWSGEGRYDSTYEDGGTKLKQEVEGNFLNGELNGRGKNTIYYAVDNECEKKILEGEFKNSKLNGEGTVYTIYRTGEIAECTEKGTFVNGSLSGSGEIKWVYFDDNQNGNVESNYNGEIKNSSPNGQGTFIRIYKDPNEKYVFEGEMKNGSVYNGNQISYNTDTGEIIKVTTYKNGSEVSSTNESIPNSV